HPHGNKSCLLERIDRRRLSTPRRRQLRLAQTRPANGRQRTSHVPTPLHSPPQHAPTRNHRYRSQRKRTPTCSFHSRRLHHRLSLLHLRLFPPRQRQHDPRRIPLPRRTPQARNESRQQKSRHLHFHGLRQSLRRALGPRNRPGHSRLAQRHPRQHRLTRRHRRHRLARSRPRSLHPSQGSRRRNRTGRPSSFPSRQRRREN